MPRTAVCRDFVVIPGEVGRHVADDLARFFDQFEPAEGWRPRLSDQDHREIARHLDRHEIASRQDRLDRALGEAQAFQARPRDPATGEPLAWGVRRVIGHRDRYDGRAAAVAFRDRIRAEREADLQAARDFRAKVRRISLECSLPACYGQTYANCLALGRCQYPKE